MIIFVLTVAAFAAAQDSKSAAKELEILLNKYNIPKAIETFERNVVGNENYYIDEDELDKLGYGLIKLNKIEKAVTVFKLSVKILPGSWRLLDSLGEAFMYQEDKVQAVQAYEKSLEINPKNRNAKKKIRNMDGYVAGISRETRTPARFKPGENTGIKDLYFGEEPPGLKPKVFAPGIVSTRGNVEYACAFTPDGKELFYTSNVGKTRVKLYACNLEKNGWTAPKEPAFSEGYLDFSPYITPDGNQLIFNRVFKDKDGAVTGRGNYVLKKTPTSWSKPEKFPWKGMFFSSTEDGTLYTTIVPRGIGIYIPVNNGYKGPIMLKGGIQLADHVFVSRDARYIVLDAEDIKGYGNNDLYICFPKQDGTWGKPVNLGPEINGPDNQSMPCISPDNKYLFFTSKRDIYWISIKYLDRFIKGGGHPQPKKVLRIISK